jgi:Ethanolamine utilization protein EutJ (predicted chaperonin)/outer membrane murein-binding lipoprotein Lpp
MARISIGLDIGHQQVRAVALAPAGGALQRAGKRARVLATACVARFDGEGRAKPLAATLAEIETLLGRRGNLIAHLGDAGTLVRFVPTIPLPPDRRQRLLRLELLQHADEAGDLAVDAWEVAIPGEEIVHGCIIGQPAQILASLGDLRAAGLSQPEISFAPATMANVLPPDALEGSDLALVVDIGGAVTGVTLVGSGGLLACRQLPISGETFTTALLASGGSGGDRASAERRKIDGPPPPVDNGSIAPAVTVADPERKRTADASFDALFEDDAPSPQSSPAATAVTGPALAFELDDGDLSLELDTPAPPPRAPAPPVEHLSLTIDDGDAPAGDPITPAAPVVVAPSAGVAASATPEAQRQFREPELQRAAEAFYAQLAASLLWFKSQLRLEKVPVTKVYLVGGGAALVGLDVYLQRRFTVPVVQLDPFADLEAPAAPADRGAWAAAIGLALSDPRYGGRHAVRFDVRPESLIRAAFRWRHLVWPYVAAACLVLAALVSSIVLLRQSGAQQESLAAYSDWKAKHDELSKRLTTLDNDKNALAEDLRAIAGRIYAGRDLLYTVRALKEQADKSPELWVTRLETKGVSADPGGNDGLYSTQAAAPKSYDSAIDRGAVLLSGRVKFSAAETDVGRDQFLKTWREAVRNWKPAPDMPTLFQRQRVVLWDPNHRPTTKGGKAVDEGEFPFQIQFDFSPTDLSQITASRGATP